MCASLQHRIYFPRVVGPYEGLQQGVLNHAYVLADSFESANLTHPDLRILLGQVTLEERVQTMLLRDLR